MKNRLQFVHCDKLFNTNVEAKEYVIKGDLISIERPALYAEPMVLKYGDEENPNIILAIGSVGDGVTKTTENRVFFIDFADIEKSIAEIKGQIDESNSEINSVKELLSTVISSCGFDSDGNYVPDTDDNLIGEATSISEAIKLLSKAIIDNYDSLINEIHKLDERIVKLENFDVKESNTIHHELLESDSGRTLVSDVKLSDFRTVNDHNFHNIIIKQEDGLYANVRMAYDVDDNKLIFGVNDEVKEFSLPKENHVISGEYDTKTESLILTFKEPINDSENTLSIDLSKLIGEWKVLGENTDTPIILTKTPVKSDDILHGAESYQDILKADVRIATSEYKPYNILKKTEDNLSLYVDGIADNIKYLKDGKIITVKEALDAVDDNVSNHDGNIIYRKEDGIFANVELEYVTGQNKLKFIKTNKDGGNDVTELQLNNITFLETIFYDSLTEEIVIMYKDANGETKELRVPVSTLFEEWEVENTNHTVTLTKTLHQTAGKDKLSADVNIASTSDNILRVVNHGLHVKGTSDNIKHGSGTVKDSLDLLNGTEDTDGSVRNLIKVEKDRAEGVERTLESKILENTTAISEESSRAKAAEEANKNLIDNETLRAKSEEKRIEDKFDTAISKQGTVNTQITDAISSLRSDLTAEVTRSTNKDNELSNKITTEEGRAISEEQRIETAFNSFKENSERQHTEIGNRITTVEGLISNETSERISNDQVIGEALSNEILRAKEAENKLTSDLAALNEKVSINSDGITSINTNISSLNKKIDDEISRATGAENANKLLIAEEKSSRENKDTELSGLISANLKSINDEVTRATNAESALDGKIANNTKLISDEVTRAMAAEKANSDSIVSLEKKTTMTANNSGTINLTKTVLENGEGYTLSGSVNVSDSIGNIINRDGNALFASVDLVYDSGRNVLTLKTSNNSDKEIALNVGSVITNIEYVSEEKKLVIHYTDAQGQPKEVSVNVSDLFNEIEVENLANNAVTLSIRDKGDGTKILSADVNVASEPDNLLVKSTGNLYVSNAAKGIKFEDSKTLVDVVNEIKGSISSNKTDSDAKYSELSSALSVVDGKVEANKTKITELEAKDSTLNTLISDISGKLTQEINDRTVSDNALGVEIEKLDTKLTTEVSKLTNSDNALSSKITNLETNLAKEVDNRTNADNILRDLIRSNTDLINGESNKRELEDIKLGTNISEVQVNLDVEVQRAVAREDSLSDLIGKNTENITNLTSVVEQNRKDATCSVSNTQTISLVKEPNTSDNGYVLSGNVNISSADGNIINPNGPLFASVDLQYNSASNKLSLITSNNIVKEVTLSVGSIIKSISYDSDNKRLVLVYIDESQEEKTIYVPITDLYNEWIVEDRDSSVIKLTKVKGIDGQPDVLQAELKLSTLESNLIQNTNGNLYASNRALDIKLSDENKTSVETAIKELDKRVDSVENAPVNITVEDTSSVDITLIKGVEDNVLKADVKISSSENNMLELNSDGLFVLEDYDFGTY